MADYILVVEDNPDLNELYCRSLTLTGKLCYGVKTVAEALEVLEATTPDLIVLDLQLDDGKGTAILDYLQGANRPQTHVIVVSAEAFTAVDGLERYAGIDHVLLKPVSPRGLMALVNSMA